MNGTQISFLSILGLITFAPVATAGVAVGERDSESEGKTIVTVTKTVTADWKKQIQYSWEVKESVAQPFYTVVPGQATDVQFDIQVVRKTLKEQDAYALNGNICVKNEGHHWTHGLKLFDRLQKKIGETFENVTGTTHEIEADGEIGPSEVRCFPYRFEAPLDEKGEYRSNASICIKNLDSDSESDKSTHCISANAAIRLPEQPVLTEIGKTASLSQVMNCPNGLSCQYSSIDRTLDQSIENISLPVSVRLSAAACASAKLQSTATVSSADERRTQSASAVTELQCGPAPSPLPSPFPGGCTMAVDYWKLHAGSLSNPDLVSPLLPVTLGNCGGLTVSVTHATDAVAILSNTYCPDGLGNGIGLLYAQLLGAHLNAAQGSDASAISSTMSDVDTYLVRHNCTDWAYMTVDEKNTVMAWQSQLNNYNNGIIGPGHCPLK